MPEQRHPKGHRRRDHIPRHVREEHRIARTAAAGAAGAMVVGAAFGLTSGALSGEPDTTPTGNSLDTLLDARADQAASRGMARAPASTSAVAGVVPRAEPADVRQQESRAGVPSQPMPEIPEDCDEYSGNRAIGCALLSEYGFGLDQMPALDELWSHESGWNHEAYNPSSGAYGIPQALPGNKMATAGDDWETNPATQIRWGLGYIKDRYGSPQAAWDFWQANGWY